MEPPRHDKPLFSFYGDDFTGSTDALEALAGSGFPAVLFLKLPDAAGLARFADCRAVGLAGESRSRPPEWMRAELPAVFRWLRDTGAPVVQYKVCSTFDSAPDTGSIGCALEIGQQVFGVPWVPVIPAAPQLGRWVVFGNLFARESGAVYRIDRHPAMRSHPVTPMAESDLVIHLSRQTTRKVALMDVLALTSPDPRAALDRLLEDRPEAVLFDGLGEHSLVEAARLICESIAGQRFVIGSSAMTHAMVQYWRAMGWIPPAGTRARAGRADRLLVLSGSCAPATGRQIGRVLRDGFQGIRLDPARLADAGARAMLLDEAAKHLGAGRNVVLYSALGPEDCRDTAARLTLAEESGRLLRELILRSGVRRVAVAGGDTASHAVRELGIAALTFEALLAPGAPLCRSHSAETGLSGLELVLKGGQVGPETFFADVLEGRQ